MSATMNLHSDYRNGEEMPYRVDARQLESAVALRFTTDGAAVTLFFRNRQALSLFVADILTEIGKLAFMADNPPEPTEIPF